MDADDLSSAQDLSCAAEKLDLPKEAETWGNGRIQDHFFQQYSAKILSFAMGMHDRLVKPLLLSFLFTPVKSHTPGTSHVPTRCNDKHGWCKSCRHHFHALD
jgi:hypothetical protein